MPGIYDGQHPSYWTGMPGIHYDGQHPSSWTGRPCIHYDGQHPSSWTGMPGIQNDGQHPSSWTGMPELSGQWQDKENYKQVKKEARRAVPKAKAETLNEVYKEMETPREKKVLRIAKGDVASKDMMQIRQIKDSNVAVEGDLRAEINHRIHAGWKNWKKLCGVLCDRKIGVKLKGKVHRTVVRPAMIYGAETWAINKTEEKKLDVAEMRMLRWMCGVTRRDVIRNEIIRGTTRLRKLSDKIQESRRR
ncbi:uncharacterized protein [Palaemon carinicauda]|uniref:uncharacterized protein n=1 Tax=Palaemon carinicauda TaxID=392227 RepID=UPI0035B667A5